MNETGSGNGNARGLLPLVVFTLSYMVGAIALAIARGNQEFIFYIVVMVVLIVGVLAVHRRVRLRNATLWCLSLWGLAHMAGGLVNVPADWPTTEGSTVLYSWWLIPEKLKYDHVIHAYGFGVTTWVCWQGLSSAARPSTRLRPGFGLLVIVGAAGLGFGALNEVVEFAATLLVPETNVGGYVNTGWDLVANTVGATIAATLIWWKGHGER